MNVVNRLFVDVQIAAGSGPLAGGDSVTIPGLAKFKGIVAAMVPFALAACVLAIVVGASGVLVGWAHDQGTSIS